MKDLEMGRIARVLHRLEVVAIDLAAKLQRPVPVPAHENVVARKSRRWERAEVGPVKADYSLNRVGPLTYGEVQVAAHRLGRCLQAIALRIVEPAVVRAGDAPLFHPPVEQRRSTMGAVIRQ